MHDDPMTHFMFTVCEILRFIIQYAISTYYKVSTIPSKFSNSNMLASCVPGLT